MRRTFRSLICVVILLACFACTQSSLFDSEVALDGLSLFGQVRLNDGRSAEGAFVWLQGIEAGTRVGADGRFSLGLPPSAYDSDLLNGVFPLYFYMSNYRLDSARVVIQQGRFVYGRADVSSGGEVAPGGKTLRKFLEIQLEVEPASISASFSGEVLMTLRLQPLVSDTIRVMTPGLSTEGVARVFMLHESSGEVDTLVTDVFGIRQASEWHTLVGEALTLTMRFHWPSGWKKPGRYRLKPYLWAQYDAVPQALLKNLGFDPTRRPSFLHLPLTVNGGQLLVVTGS